MNTVLNKASAEIPLIKMFYGGKLGSKEKALRRIYSALRLSRDYKLSFFTPRVTMIYDATVSSGNGQFSPLEKGVVKHDAGERYLKAMKFLGKYQIYATHFIRDEENVRQFILKYRILNKNSLLTYTAVYKALNDMLDRLADFYDKQEITE